METHVGTPNTSAKSAGNALSSGARETGTVPDRGHKGPFNRIARSPSFALAAVGVAWACTTVTAITFALAAMSPDNRVTVTVNDYGEMPVETVLLAAAWAVVTLNFAILWWKLWTRPDDSRS